MKFISKLFPAVLFVCGLSPAGWAQSEPAVKLAPVIVTDTKVAVSSEKTASYFVNVEIRNFQDEPLGRIVDIGVDLINGRIVEVLVKSDSSLEVDNQIVAVPPLALIPDGFNKIYRLDVTPEVFKTAQAIDLSEWEDASRSQRVAAAYRLFGEEPYFLEEGATADQTADRPKVALDYVERSNRLLDLPVGNREGEPFGKVWALNMDIAQGRILSVIILAPGNFQTKSVVPAMALSFNEARDGLVLNDTKFEVVAEPRYIFTAAAFGNEAYSHQEIYKGPHTNVALEQGRSYRDIDQTVRIHRDIRAANINSRHIEVGTLNDRVTLRGWAYSAQDKNRIVEIAIAAARVELVDNQLTVGKPVTTP
jgi:sporulation protein YlmC with PRC-barrel domain